MMNTILMGAATLMQAATEAATEQTRMGLWELFTKGGWIVWLLLAIGGVMVITSVERYRVSHKLSPQDKILMNRVRDLLVNEQFDEARDLCKKTDTPTARNLEKSVDSIERLMTKGGRTTASKKETK